MCLHGQHVGCLHFEIFCLDIKVAGDPPALLRPEVEYHGGLVFWGVHLSALTFRVTSHSKQMGRDSAAGIIEFTNRFIRIHVYGDRNKLASYANPKL